MTLEKDVKIVSVDDDVKKEQDEVKSATFSQLFSTADIFDYLLMFVGSFGGCITGLSMPFFNILFGDMVDTLNTDSDAFADEVGKIAINFVIVAGVQIVSCTLQVGCWTLSGERQTQKLREKYVQAILSQEIGWFDQCGAATLATRVADNTGKLKDGITRKAGDLCQFSAQFIGAFGVGFYLCWQLTVVLLASFPLIAAAGLFMIQAITAAQNQSGENYAQAGGLASEALNSIRTVSALNTQPIIIKRYRAFLFDAMNIGIVKGFKVGLGNGLVFACCFLTYALGFWYGGKLIADGMDNDCGTGGGSKECITGGVIISTFFSIIIGSFSLGQIAPPLSAFFAAKAAVYPMMEVIERVPLIDQFSSQGDSPKVRSVGKIELKDIFFHYPSRPEIEVCKGYNLTINPGEVVALVGPSGSGKSTIINLLLRFYDPSSGCLLLDGQDIKTLNVRWLRSQIGYVGQEPVLFKGSVEDNIAFGLGNNITNAGIKGESTFDGEIKEKIIAAAKLANAHDFITEFPDGYATDIGSAGIAVSGGQKQRIAIARALIKKPAVLLLDEATSALDTTSERMVQDSIAELQKSKQQTTIVIAHRLSTIRNADKIAVINEGRIVELGTHDELVSLNGRYADLIRLQVADETAPEFSSDSISKDINVKVEKKLVENIKEDNTENANKTDGKTNDDKDVKDESMSRVWSLVYGHAGWLIMALIGGALFGCVFPFWGLLLSMSFDMFYQPTSDLVREKAAQQSFYYCVASVITLASGTALFYGSAQLSERISMRLRSNMFEAILRREMSFFDKEENSIGSLTTKLSDDSRVVSKATGESLAKQLQAIFTLVVGISLGFTASWKVSAVVLATFPLNVMAEMVVDAQMTGQANKNEKVGQEGAIISSAFSSMRTISAFSMQFKILEEYSVMTTGDSSERKIKAFKSGLGFGLAQATLFCTYALLFWYGSTLITEGELTFEMMMRALFCIMMGAMGMGTALNDMGDQKEGALAAKRIFNTLEDAQKSTVDGLSASGLKPATSSIGKIELKDIFFHYPSRPEIEVCKGYNLTINPGEVVALVGPSGSGKSTIINLLLRFYDPSSGCLLLDGQDIKTLNVRWLRSQIGYVGQEPVLFKGSVEDNILWGLNDIDNAIPDVTEDMLESDKKGIDFNLFSCLSNKTDSKISLAVSQDDAVKDIEMGNTSNIFNDMVIDAAKISQAHDFITEFPNGYATDIGESSIMVSGGQKQRIAIARALIKKPAVLLLDEATSALDTTSERLVQQSIDELQKSKQQTTIVIAHRLSTIRNADKIAVINEGRIVELGTHDELVSKSDSLYHSLWNKQQSIAVDKNICT